MLPRDIATWNDPAVFFKITDFAAENEKKKNKKLFVRKTGLNSLNSQMIKPFSPDECLSFSGNAAF